jgi:hypothetical protein
MIGFVALLATTSLVVVSATNVKTKFTSKGYSAYASNSYPGCNAIYGSQLDVGVYASKYRFKETAGDAGVVQTDKLDDFYFSFTSSSCNNATVSYQRGSIYEFENYGDNPETEFKIEGGQLTKAWLKGVRVPVYGNECSYYCTEMCYPEIFGYGTCPETEPAYLECYTLECGTEEYLGTARVSVHWKVPKRLGDEGLHLSNSMYRSRSDGYTYMSRSRGQYRYDVPVTVKATLDGSDLFPSSPVDEYAELGKTRSKEVQKTKCIE